MRPSKPPQRTPGRPPARPTARPAPKPAAQPKPAVPPKAAANAWATPPKPPKPTGPAPLPVKLRPAKSSVKGLRVLDARFVAAVQGVGEVPPGPAEIAVVGRSNVGKSSLVNALSGRNHLARTSKTPGRTQAIILFDLDLSTGETVRLVDVPGFGHAKVSRTLRDTFSPMIMGFLEDSKHLKTVLILQDCRRETDADALGFAQWLREQGKRVDVVATKLDELPRTKRSAVLHRLEVDFDLEHPVFATSVREGLGITDLLHHLRRLARPPGTKAAQAKALQAQRGDVPHVPAPGFEPWDVD